MKKHEYAAILAALDAAIKVFEAHPVHFGFEREAYERLRELRDRTVAAQLDLGPSLNGASA